MSAQSQFLRELVQLSQEAMRLEVERRKPRQPEANWSQLSFLDKLRKKQEMEETLKNSSIINDQAKQIELKVDKCKREIEGYNKELQELKNKSGYRSEEEMKTLTDRMDEINDMKAQCLDIFGEDNEQDKMQCPICYSNAKNKEIYTCIECDHWFCKDCKLKQTSTCPMCRCNLRFKPMIRNKALERVFRI